jgi:hypothetical protein
MGGTWALVWAGVGAGIAILFSILRPQDIGTGETPLRIAAILGLAGLMGGAGCGAMLALLERGRTVSDLSLGRVATWGAVAAGVVPALLGADPSQAFWTAPLGAGLAAASVGAARRAEHRLGQQPDQPLIESDRE